MTSSTHAQFQTLHEMPDYDYFFKNFLAKNVPCLIKNSFVGQWKSSRDWVKGEKPNLEFFQELSNLEVPVYDCRAKYFNSHEAKPWPLQDYLKYWESRDERLLYLKDWHFRMACPKYQAYSVPVIFASDWLNEYCDATGKLCEDYRFVYIGPKDSFTPFHSDVFNSFSWSANVVGKKLWIFVPPGKEKSLVKISGSLPTDIQTGNNFEKCHHS